MDDFAKQFQAMRESRRLTQQQLAIAAGVSLTTVSVVERTGVCDWRRTTASEIYRALAKRAPLSAEERRQFQAGTGIEEIPFGAADAHQSMFPLGESFGDISPAQRQQHAALVAQMNKLVSRFGPSVTGQAMDLLLQLVDLGASDAVRRWNQPEPPTKASPSGPVAHISAPIRMEDREVTVITPIKPATAPKAGKRRKGTAG